MVGANLNERFYNEWVGLVQFPEPDSSCPACDESGYITFFEPPAITAFNDGYKQGIADKMLATASKERASTLSSFSQNPVEWRAGYNKQTNIYL